MFPLQRGKHDTLHMLDSSNPMFGLKILVFESKPVMNSIMHSHVSKENYLEASLSTYTQSVGLKH